MDAECLTPLLCGTSLGVDRISKLPDDIIVDILSLLSLRDAARSSILSWRWSDLWKHTPNLDFNVECLNCISPPVLPHGDYSCNSNINIAVERCKYIQLVDTVIKSHKAISLKKFRIYFYVDNSAKSAVAKWLEFVFSRKVEALGLKFECYLVSRMVVLEELLRAQTDVILFKSLQSLSLECLKVSGEDIELFLRSCPLLEILIIRRSNLTSSHVKVCGATLKLRRFDIRHCIGVESLRVSAPHLKWIRFDDESKNVLFENVPNLVRAGFRIKRRYVAQLFASGVSCFISQLQMLTLSMDYPKEFLANGFPRMPNLNNLKILKVIDYGVHKKCNLLPITTTLIRAFPHLKQFIFKFCGNAKDATSQIVTNVEKSPHKCLNRIEFQGTSWEIIDRIVEQAVTYISNNCVALQQISVGGPGGGADVQADRDRLKQKLQAKLPHHIQLQFSNL